MLTHDLQNNDMNQGAKLSALNKFRNGTASLMRQPSTRVLVVYDVIIKTGDTPQVPLVVNYGKHLCYCYPMIINKWCRFAQGRGGICSSVSLSSNVKR